MPTNWRPPYSDWWRCCQRRRRINSTRGPRAPRPTSSRPTATVILRPVTSPRSYQSSWAFFVFFFVFLISGIGLLRERSSGTLDRLLATPVRRGEIVTGYMVSYGVVAIVQTLLIVITTVWLLKVQIVGDLALVFLINILLALAALAMGIFISTFASSEFQMMQFVPIVVMPQVFFSGIVPLDALPNWIQVISKILPLTYAGNAMNDVIMKGQGVETIAGDLGVLVLFIVFFVVLNVMGLKRYRKV
ncbi:ABC transporter permease component [Limosilactobacillus fermentum CECT 5716]|nr:ABC transporter permease component [Limosilactobacillus fermentum CECT 5716]